MAASRALQFARARWFPPKDVVRGVSNYLILFMMLMCVSVLLVTLNGAIVFAVDLLKKLTIKCKISCVKLSSYSGTSSTNVVKNLIGLTDDLHGKRVLILEDIVDTGRTYQHLVDMLTEVGVKDLRIATMTYKPEAYKLDLPIHYCAFTIPNKFVVGRGLDYDGYGRNLPDIYQLKIDD